jgi:hypothetical protein
MSSVPRSRRVTLHRAPTRRGPGGPATASADHDGVASRHRVGRALLAIGVVYAVAQLLLIGVGQAWRWDEAIYLSQVNPRVPATFFEAHRARGITVVALPAAVIGAPLELARAYVIAVSSTAFVLAFRPWVRAIGWPAVAAAAAAASGWVFVYFGPELYPNLLAAYAALGTTGSLYLWTREGRRIHLVAVVIGVAVVAALRPSESVFLAAGLTPWILWQAGRARWRGIGALLVGGFLGWLPWLIEAIVRFGGPFDRLRDGAGSSIAGQSRNSLIQYLNLTEGPVQQVVADPMLTVRSLAFLLLLATLGVLGVAQRGDRPARHAALLGAVVGTALLLPYLTLNTGVNVRYLAPALALYAVPIGAGITTVAVALYRAHSRMGAAVAVVLVAVVVGWQASIAAGIADELGPIQARPAVVSEALIDAADGRPCAFLTVGYVPGTQYYTGCLGDRLILDTPSLQCPDAPFDMAALAEQGYAVFVFEHRDPDADDAHADWDVVERIDHSPGDWRVWERPSDLGPNDPPHPADPADAPVPCPPSTAPEVYSPLQLVWERPD